MPTNSVPKMGANLGPIKRNFDVQVRLHFWGGVGGHVAPQSTFLEAQVGLLVRGSKLTNYRFYYHFLIGIKPKMDSWPTWTPQQRAQLGPPKNLPVAPKAPQPPLKNGPQLGSQKIDLGRLSCGPIWASCWRPKGAETIFLRGQ